MGWQLDEFNFVVEREKVFLTFAKLACPHVCMSCLEEEVDQHHLCKLSLQLFSV